jgi:hypothetical protein
VLHGIDVDGLVVRDGGGHERRERDGLHRPRYAAAVLEEQHAVRGIIGTIERQLAATNTAT